MLLGVYFRCVARFLTESVPVPTGGGFELTLGDAVGGVLPGAGVFSSQTDRRRKPLADLTSTVFSHADHLSMPRL